MGRARVSEAAGGFSRKSEIARLFFIGTKPFFDVLQARDEGAGLRDCAPGEMRVVLKDFGEHRLGSLVGWRKLAVD